MNEIVKTVEMLLAAWELSAEHYYDFFRCACHTQESHAQHANPINTPPLLVALAAKPFQRLLPPQASLTSAPGQ